MTLTAAQQEIVDQLSNEWWRLDAVIEDDQDRADFMWDVARARVDLSSYFCSTLANYVDPSVVNDAIDFLIAMMETFDDQQHRGSKLWDHSAEWMLRRISEDGPAPLHKRLDELPEAAEDFARMFLVAQDAAQYGPLTDRAMLRLARAWAATSWDEPWYEAREPLTDEEWEDLVLESLATYPDGLVEWPRIRAFAARATVPQKLAIIEQDHSPSIRKHLHTMLSGSTLDELVALEAGFDQFDIEQDYYADRRRGALAIGTMIHGSDVGWEPSETAIAALSHDLLDFGDNDLDLAAAALETLSLERRESILLDAIDRSHAGLNCVFAVAWVAPTEAVIAGVFDHLRQLEARHPNMDSGLVGFGAQIVEPLCCLLQDDDLARESRVTSIVALGRIGDPRAASTLVEQLTTGGVEARDAALVALETLGDASVDALRAGLEHRRVRVREACAELLQAHELAQANPLTDLEARFDGMAHDDLNATLAKIVTDQQVDFRSTDVTRHAESYGIFVMLRVRDWFLENPADWYRRDVWKNVAEFFRKDPDVAWIVVDGFARLAEQEPWSLDQHVEVLSKIADRDPRKTTEAIAHYLRGRPPAHRAAMLRVLLDHAHDPPVDVLLRAMQDDSKVVRALGIEGVRRAGDEHVGEVVALVTASRKHVREAAANALAEMPSSSVLPQLQAAYEAEKTVDVRTALERAIRQAGGAAIELPVDDDEASFDAFLADLARADVPEFAAPSKLPRLRYAGSSTTLSDEATRGLLVRLMKEGPTYADPVARQICSRLDTDDVQRFGRAIFDAWEETGGDSQHKWVIYQLAITGGTDVLDAFGPTLDELAGSSNHHRALWFLDAFRRHPEPDAQAWILHWSRWAERASVKSAAQAHIAEAAQEAQVSQLAYEARLNAYIADDVADRTMPTLGLESPLVVDYGVRCFEIRLSRNHQLAIVETTQAELVDRLPTPRKAETPDENQLERYRDTRQQLRRVVRQTSARLEQAMATGRPWTRIDFEQFFGSHPIAVEFARRLVFMTSRGVLFRRADGEDLSADWDTVDVSPGETICLAHPLDMSDDERERWSQHLADTEIVQPFEQIGRPIHLMTDHALQEITKYGPLTTATFVRRRAQAGWIRGLPREHEEMIYTAVRPFPGRRQRAVLQHHGYHHADLQWNPDDELLLERLWFEDFEGNELGLKDIDPRAYSEVRIDLHRWFR